MSSLILLLGDQCSSSVTSLRGVKSSDTILMAEVNEEATYVKHHKKKIAFVFSVMRHFAAELKAKKLKVKYIYIDDPENSGSITGEIQRLLKTTKFEQVVVTEPGEYRLLREIKGWQKLFGLPVKIMPYERFIASHKEFETWANNRKQLTMEFWYRQMRRKTNLLMDGDKPVGGKWNFDKQNRKSLKQNNELRRPLKFETNKITNNVLQVVSNKFSDHFGDLKPFWFAVTAKQAKKAMEHFIKHQLPWFGDYQDAMLSAEPFLFHSVISQYINCGLLDPLEVCQNVEQAFVDGHVPLNAAEGFIRQIIGWREYIRGIYWHQMPEYAKLNVLNATRPLPAFYWDANTEMKCVSDVVNMTRAEGYSHHIQRLMITGNFANLAGLDIKSVCDWYLAVYTDAYEWVELPNTLGMALYADGGIVGTKPYISTGSYINRMSNYCKQCTYNYSKRVGQDACPFTNLYWYYLIRHEERFKDNHRMTLSYKNLSRLSDTEKKQISSQAQDYLDNLV
jgi:deoxyribodipyrimidine photolyase-related protein